MADGGAATDGIEAIDRVQHNQVSGLADLYTVLVSDIQSLCALPGDHVVASVDLSAACHLPHMHQHGSDIQHVACAQRVPGVEDAIVPQADVHALLPEFFDAS